MHQIDWQTVFSVSYCLGMMIIFIFIAKRLATGGAALKARVRAVEFAVASVACFGVCAVLWDYHAPSLFDALLVVVLAVRTYVILGLSGDPLPASYFLPGRMPRIEFNRRADDQGRA